MTPSSLKTGSRAADAINVLVVGDSEVVCGIVADVFRGMPDVNVVARPAVGAIAASQVRREDIDVAVLDIGAPDGDGLVTLGKLLAADKDIKVIAIATLTFRNVKLSMDALVAGAAEFIPVLSMRGRQGAGVEFRRELKTKVRALGKARRGAVQKPEPARKPAVTLNLRRPASVRPRAIVIGSSTGGPMALIELFKNLPVTVRQPILIAQHMPATFTARLAQHIEASSGFSCREGRDGEEIRDGQVYIAPGDYHMVLVSGGAAPRIALNQDLPVNYCRPAVDPLFSSAAQVFGAATLAVVLTGMGHDGLAGARDIVAAGGTVIAQDEASSVVWGMPGAVAEAGICADVLPQDQIPGVMARYAGKGA